MAAGTVWAQTPQEEYEAWKKQAQGNYSRYRQQANDDYQAFRKKANEEYAEFMQSAWARAAGQGTGTCHITDLRGQEAGFSIAASHYHPINK